MPVTDEQQAVGLLHKIHADLIGMKQRVSHVWMCAANISGGREQLNQLYHQLNAAYKQSQRILDLIAPLPHECSTCQHSPERCCYAGHMDELDTYPVCEGWERDIRGKESAGHKVDTSSGPRQS